MGKSGKCFSSTVVSGKFTSMVGRWTYFSIRITNSSDQVKVCLGEGPSSVKCDILNRQDVALWNTAHATAKIIVGNDPTRAYDCMLDGAFQDVRLYLNSPSSTDVASQALSELLPKCSAYCSTCSGASCSACAQGYYLNSNVCSPCPNSCKACDSYTSCTLCNASHFIYRNECFTACPAGLTKNTTTRSCLGTVAQLYIHYKFQSLLDTMPDEQGRYPAKTSSVKPPVPVYKRGYYFDDSLVTISKDPVYASSNLLTLAAWISPRARSNANAYVYAISSEEQIKWGFSVSGDDLILTYESVDVLKTPFIEFTADFPTAWFFAYCYLREITKTEAEVGIFTTLSGLKKASIEYDYQIFSTETHDFTIGGLLADHYFVGFIYDMKIYNYYETGYSSHYTKSCAGCNECPSGSCISLCAFNQWLTGHDCMECTNPDYSCLDNKDSSLCIYEYCSKCPTFEAKCTECNPTFELKSDKTCNCPSSTTFYENMCYSCQQNCLICNFTGCIECASKHFKDPDGICQACPVNCLVCSSLYECEMCVGTLVFSEGECKVIVVELPDAPPPDRPPTTGGGSTGGGSTGGGTTGGSTGETPTDPKGPTTPGQNNNTTDPTPPAPTKPKCTELCEECISDECVSCKANASLTSECNCNQGYVPEDSMCKGIVIFAGGLGLKLDFPRGTAKPLEDADFIVTSIASVAFKAKIQMAFSSRFYFMIFDLEAATTDTYAFSLDFMSNIYDSQRVPYSKATIYFTIEWSQPYHIEAAEQASIESESAQATSVAASQTTTGISVATSIMTSDLSLLLTLLNAFQVLSYIPLLQIDLPPKVKGTLVGINLMATVPNPLDRYLQESESQAKPYKKAQDYGIKTTNFIVNIGEELTIIIVVVFGFIIFYLVSLFNCSEALKSFCVSRISDYRYNVVISTWIGLYLDVALAAMIQLDKPSYHTLYIGASTIISYGVMVCVVATPAFLIIGTLTNYKVLLTNNDIYNRWSILFDDFKPTKVAMIQNGWFFIMRALLVFITVGCRNADIQVISCFMLMMTNLGLDVVLKPYYHSQDSFLNVLTKAMMFLAYSSIMCYHYQVSLIDDDMLMYLIYAGVGTIGFFSLVLSLVKIFVFMVSMLIKIKRKYLVHERPTKVGDISVEIPADLSHDVEAKEATGTFEFKNYQIDRNAVTL
mmetsp:Transcript_7098/g.12988  ORF Transcript_7098/g.12988 Transcript_7098/m.12988 type:complete len:1170 (-) Transcript_7098:2648-6157(-)